MKETLYRKQLREAMTMLGQNPRTIFLGQTVACPGSKFTYDTFDQVPLEKRIELPIMEEVQMGMSIGLALAGYIPVSIYPRVDFVLLAANQLVNHLDKIFEMSNYKVSPKVIIKASVGSTHPLHPGPQHSQNHIEQLRGMLQHVDVNYLERPEQIVPAYRKAIESSISTLLVDEGNSHFTE